jgi:hypothetical protein
MDMTCWRSFNTLVLRMNIYRIVSEVGVVVLRRESEDRLNTT